MLHMYNVHDLTQCLKDEKCLPSALPAPAPDLLLSARATLHRLQYLQNTFLQRTAEGSAESPVVFLVASDAAAVVQVVAIC